MPSDSLYLAVSEDCLDKVVRKELWDEWLVAKQKWFPRTDNPENAAFDKRTPGTLLTIHMTHYIIVCSFDFPRNY